MNQENTVEESDVKEAAPFLKITDVRNNTRAKNLRLKENDIIALVDGIPFHGNRSELIKILSEDKGEWLITIYRDNVLFEIIIRGSLGVGFKQTTPEETLSLEETLENHNVFDISEYRIFEVLRNIHREVDILETTPNFMSWFFPPIWLVQNRLWEVLMVSFSLYFISLSIAWWIFLITWTLLALYLRKGQTTLIRSFSIYREKHFWLILAARNEEQVQKVCRSFDRKCIFDYSLVGKPIDEELEEPENKDNEPAKASA